jgi:hypothetical protein
MANVSLRCPRCAGSLPTGLAPALSRTDNRTHICGACARVEGHVVLAGLPAGPLASPAHPRVTDQLDLFAATAANSWPEGRLSWTREPFWSTAWSPCDVDGSLPYWRCARDHNIDARCSVVFRLTHPVHRRDREACSPWPCNGRRCQRQ